MYAIKPTSHNNILSSFSNNIHGMLKNKKSDFIGFFILILMLDVKKTIYPLTSWTIFLSISMMTLTKISFINILQYFHSNSNKQTSSHNILQ